MEEKTNDNTVTEVIKEITEKQLTLKDVNIIISLAEYFMLRYWQRHESTITVTKEWFIKQGLANNQELSKLIYIREYNTEKETLLEIWRIEDWNRTHVAKDEVKRNEEVNIEIAKSKHVQIEQWKRQAIRTLLIKGKGTLDNKKANELITRAMNPTTPFEKKLAESLNYPFRDDLTVETTSISATGAKHNNNLL